MSVAGRSFLVTGGTGFIGRGLVRALLRAGAIVRVFDDDSRGSAQNLQDIASEIEFFRGDIRESLAVREAVKGMDAVCHLAYVNGTEFFYSMPERVLEVAVKGMTNVLDACIAEGVGELSLASSSEVYQTPPKIPTDESAPLSVPDPRNPRYSYGGGKIISELMALNYGRKYFRRVTIFRPHNVYGPRMGWEHVIPQFAVRIKELCRQQAAGTLDLTIQGTGRETRAFAYIDDAAEGILSVLEKGEHLEIYNVGTDRESAIADVASEVARCFGREIRIVPGELRAGGALRRCPDISRLRALGYSPKISLSQGIEQTVKWYREHDHQATSRAV